MQYRLDIAYDGTNFVGWQTQPNGPTIQAAIERALSTVLRTPTSIVGSSRTDAGVHADHQVATFKTIVDLDINKIQRSLNAILPDAIKINSIIQSNDSFHPIGSAVQKVYSYKIWNERKAPPKARLYSWAIGRKLDVEAFRVAAKYLSGEHDFRAFMATDACVKTTVREVFETKVLQMGPSIEFWISGNGFLKQMVRSIVGTLVEIGLSRKSPEIIERMLQLRERELAGATAPARGLTLVHIGWERVRPLDDVIL